MKTRKTNEQFLMELGKINPNIEPLEEYVKANTKIKIKCKVCNHEWESSPSNLLSGYGCPKCSIKYGHIKLTKTNEQFLKELTHINPNVIPLENYSGADNKILCRCKICNHIWETTGSRLINKKRGCPNCAGTTKKTNEEFIKQLKEINPKIEPIDEYTGANRIIKVKCSKCNHILETTPDRLVRRRIGCPKCSLIDRSIKTRKTNEEFLKQLKDISPELMPIETYINSSTKIKIKCTICGKIFKASPANLISKHSRCPNLCTRPKASSTEEHFFADYIKYQINLWVNQVSKNNKYKEENLRKKYKVIQGRYFNAGYEKYQLDIYFPNLKIGIEYDGNYWHSDKIIEKNYQLNKRKFFDDLGIRVIFIRSDEWLCNTEKILNRILSILGIYARKGNARKMYIDNNVSTYEANKLMEISHTQCRDNSSIKIGLRTKNGTLVSLMTFSKVRNIINSKEDLKIPTYELVRYCNYPNTIINGAFGKLLKEAEKILKSMGIKRIKTFADRRFSSDIDNIYLKNGFILSKISNPNYVYIRKGLVYSRYECQKHKLKDLLKENFDENLSEYENMSKNGFLRIYDCGNLVYYKEIK